MSSSQPRILATLQQLHEDRMPSDRGLGEDKERTEQMAEAPAESPCELGAEDDAREDEDEEDAEDESQDEEGSDAAEDPDWMSFATPDGFATPGGDLLTNFEELWSQGHPQPDTTVGRTEPSLPSLSELTSEAIWQLVADRAQQEIARALAEAERDRARYGPQLSGRQSRVLLRRGQVSTPRRPKRGERGELVADLAREAKNSELLRTGAQRLGKSVARAGSAMQDAAQFARVAGGAVASRAHGHANAGPIPEESRVKPLVIDAADARNAKMKAVQAAHNVKSKLLQRMPKGLRKQRTEECPRPEEIITNCKS